MAHFIGILVLTRCMTWRPEYPDRKLNRSQLAEQMHLEGLGGMS